MAARVSGCPHQIAGSCIDPEIDALTWWFTLPTATPTPPPPGVASTNRTTEPAAGGCARPTADPLGARSTRWVAGVGS